MGWTLHKKHLIRSLIGALFVAFFVLLAGCGGGGGGGKGGSGGSGGPTVTVTAVFQPATRVVPGYADTLRVTVTPPEGVSLPSGMSDHFNLVRSDAKRVLQGLEPNDSSYGLKIEAIASGAVVGTAQRSVFVTAGSDTEIDVSAYLNSLVKFVGIDGPSTIEIGDNAQLTAHAENAAGETLFTGAGFSWTSSDPLTLHVDQDTGFVITVKAGTATIQATLKGTLLKGSRDVTVSTGPFVGVSPSDPKLHYLQRQQFTAQTVQLPSQNVTWSVEEPGGGSISQDGLYTAPAIDGTYHVRATSTDSPTIYGRATVKVDEGWVVYQLHPAGASGSLASDVYNGKVVGWVAPAGENFHAALWIGTSGLWTDLTPPNSQVAGINAIDGNQQFGFVEQNGVYHGALWTGTAQSYVSLTPPGAADSYGLTAYGGVQGGTVDFDGHDKACIWYGTPDSVVVLHPAGATDSAVRGIYEDEQVGSAVISGVLHAGLWTGTPDSWVDLLPAGATSSRAYDVYSGTEVGYATFGGSEHAGLWTGTAASWKDLNPAGSVRSWVEGIDANEEVGFVTFAGQFRASIWSGSAGTWRDLHRYLPTNYGSSVAHDIWHDGNVTYVAGEATNKITNIEEAILWVRTSG